MQVRIGALPGSYENGMTYAEVLAINHFGCETISPRPVLREAAEKLVSTPEMKKHLKAYSDNMIEYFKRGRLKDMKEAEEKMLSALGRQAVAEAKRLIESRTIIPENADSTIVRKPKVGNKPLYETGQLEKHLGHEVVE